jgi:hypothetical protein
VPPSSASARWSQSITPPRARREHSPPRCRRRRDSPRLASGPFAGSGQLKGEAAHVFDFFTADTGLTWEQIGNDLLRGETLGQIAGTHAARVEGDALNQVRAGLSLGVVKGAITPAQETRLVDDARDAISVLMAAKLNALLPAGR